MSSHICGRKPLIMKEGKYIITQVTQFVPRQIFQRLVKKYNGGYRVREFNFTNQLKYMPFGQLMPCDSLRDICLCLNKQERSLRPLDYNFGKRVYSIQS